MPLDMQLPGSRGLFIAGTCARAGKSLIMGAIASILSQRGLRVGVFKPIAVGARNKWDGLLAAEVEFLAGCAGTNAAFTTINPVAYCTDAAPVLGAMREHRAVDFDRIAAAYRSICEQSDVVLVEGLDGVRTPITSEHDLLDLACEFKLPVLVVAGYEDSIVNTTLMTVDCIRAARLHIAGVVINGYDVMRYESLAGNTAPAVIAEFAQCPVLADVPFEETVDVAAQQSGENTIAILEEVDWARLAGGI